MQENPRKYYNGELRFLTQSYANEIGFFSDFFRCHILYKRQRGDCSGTPSIPCLFDHYASESNKHCFGLTSGFFPRLAIMLERCQS